MHLPNRSECFACGKIERMTMWTHKGFNVVSCSYCNSEWIEGFSLGNEDYSFGNKDYSYSSYSDIQLEKNYDASRTVRFIEYLRKFSVNKYPKLLDVGCGTGHFCGTAKKLGWDSIGVELSKEAAALARKRTGLPIFYGDLIKDNLFPPLSFDLITLWGVIEHAPDPDALLDTCINLLRPGGLILMETPNVLGLFRFVAQKINKITLGHVDRPFLETLGSGHIVWYSPLGLREACRRLGLQVIEITSSRNYTNILFIRFKHLAFPKRQLFHAGTALLNYLAAPLGRPNQILAALRCG